MSAATDIWVCRAFRVGAWSLAFVFLSAFANALYLIFDGTYQLVDRFPSLQKVGEAGLLVFTACTFVLWLKSWALVFPGKTVESGYGPLVWFLLLVLGFWVTPWYVVHRARKEQLL